MGILKPKDVADMLNVKVNTLQRWDREKKLIAFRNPKTNRRYYTDEQISEFLGKKDRRAESIVIYARVSTNKQKDDLQKQIDFLRQYANAKGYIVDEVITDIDSGLNYNRKKWNYLLNKIQEKRISKIIISYKDRFVRFGYDWFDNFIKRFGCELEVVNNEVTSPNEEIIQDLISIIAEFSNRINGLKKYKKAIHENKEL